MSGNKKHTSLQHTEVKSCVCTAAQLNDSMTTYKDFLTVLSLLQQKHKINQIIAFIHFYFEETMKKLQQQRILFE